MLTRKFMIIFFVTAVAVLLLTVSSVSAQAKTNADRKAECQKNLAGEIVDYDDGGFVCNAGNYEASIICTSGGACVCTGKDCGKLGADGGLSRVGDSKAKILAKLSSKLSKKDKIKLETLVAQSLAAIKDGKVKVAIERINQVKELLGGSTWNPLFDCGEHCRKLLDGGNAPGYAVCYWACVINGGPSKNSEVFL
jgi:hypothetical protein